jgi:hypothetical protein
MALNGNGLHYENAFTHSTIHHGIGYFMGAPESCQKCSPEPRL